MHRALLLVLVGLLGFACSRTVQPEETCTRISKLDGNEIRGPVDFDLCVRRLMAMESTTAFCEDSCAKRAATYGDYFSCSSRCGRPPAMVSP